MSGEKSKAELWGDVVAGIDAVCGTLNEIQDREANMEEKARILKYSIIMSGNKLYAQICHAEAKGGDQNDRHH